MENCPDWVPGMLYIAGDGVALGYLNDEGKTREKFVFWEKTGERLYCTGDMGRYWCDGNIEFLGRTDHQVKINGYRVELGEIEAAIDSCNGIISSVVIKTMLNDKEVLAAFYKCDNNIHISPSILSSYLAQCIPQYMLPTYYEEVSNFPLGTNGKIDREILLNQIVFEKSINLKNQSKAETEIQKRVLDIWRVILNQNLGIDTDYFEAGGNSLQAIQLVNRMTEDFSREITVEDLFLNPTVRAMSELLGDN